MEIYVPPNEDTTIHFTIGSVGYRLRLFYWRGLTYADVDIGQTVALRSARVFANQWILPHYRMGDGGNFRFEAYVPDEIDYVEYSGYNTKFRLNAYSVTEIQEMENT